MILSWWKMAASVFSKPVILWGLKDVQMFLKPVLAHSIYQLKSTQPCSLSRKATLGCLWWELVSMWRNVDAEKCDCGSGSFGASGWLPRFQRWPLETKREYRSMIFLVWIFLHYYLKKTNNAEAGCGQKWPWSLRKAGGLYLSQYHWISVGVGKVWMDSSP